MSKGRIQAILKMPVVFWTWAGGSSQETSPGGTRSGTPCCAGHPQPIPVTHQRPQTGKSSGWSQKGALQAVFITLMRNCMICVKGHCIIFVILVLLYRQEHRVYWEARSLPALRGASSVLRGIFPSTHSSACSLPALRYHWTEEQPDKITSGKALPASSPRTSPPPGERLERTIVREQAGKEGTLVLAKQLA